jgi:hypothetical protein
MMTSTTGPADPPARPEELRAAKAIMDLFAQEAVVALDDLERSFSSETPDKAVRVGEEFARLWRGYGLDEVTFGPDPTDAQRILVAAANIATAPDSQGLTVQGAVAEAQKATERPLSDTVAQLRSGFQQTFGDELPVPRPREWLEQSLSRVAKSAVLRDVVSLGAEVKVSPEVRQAADNLVQQGLELDEKTGKASEIASDLNRKNHGYSDRLRDLAIAVSMEGTLLALNIPPWLKAGLVAPAAGVTLRLAWQEVKEHDHLQRLLNEGRPGLRSVRTEVAATVDTAKLGERSKQAGTERAGGTGRGE